MNKEIAFMLADALESGEYEQGADYLNKNDKFCCLGVLCDLYRKNVNPEESWVPPYEGAKGKALFFAEHSTSLPPSIQEWAGMYTSVGTPRLYSPEVTPSLAYLNDTGKSFEYIANFIRENHENL